MLIIKKNISVPFLQDPPKAFINFLSSDNQSVYAKDKRISFADNDN